VFLIARLVGGQPNRVTGEGKYLVLRPVMVAGVKLMEIKGTEFVIEDGCDGDRLDFGELLEKADGRRTGGAGNHICGGGA
jgi:hypothetical protein